LGEWDFLSELTPLLTDHAAVFSGVPFWRRDEQGTWNWRKGNKYVLGEHVKTENGIILAARIWRSTITHLTKFRQATGIDFTTYSWYDLSPQTQQQIAQAGLQAKGYDTAKLLNILLYTQGAKFAYHEPASLHHLRRVFVFRAETESSQVLAKEDQGICYGANQVFEREHL